MKYIITGGCGFVGINLALSFSKQTYKDILVIDNLSKKTAIKNLSLLKKAKISFKKIDIAKSPNTIQNLIKKTKPKVIFHLAGQVAMSTSIRDPYLDFNGNVKSTINILEGIRKHSKKTSLIFASSNKVYGDLSNFSYKETKTRFKIKKKFNGFSENNYLDFKSPYGCSKGSADQYVLDYARVFGLKTVVFRHSSIYGGRQYASYEQGWIGWFISQILGQHSMKGKRETDGFTISGSGKQVRDVLHANDLVALYESAFKNLNILNGEIFNIGGGIKNSLSILELISYIKEIKNIKSIKYSNIERRKSDQDYFCADINKAKRLLAWEPKISKEEGLNLMIEWINFSNKKLFFYS